MLRIYMYSIFTIKTPQALGAFAPLVFLIERALTNVL